MITIATITFTILQIAGSDTVLVKAIRPAYRYDENRQRTSEIEGFRYTVVAPDNKYEEFAIKVLGAKPLLTPDELDAKGGLVKAKVRGFEGRFYRTQSGDYAFTSTATGLEAATGS